MHEIINKIQKWCDVNNISESNINTVNGDDYHNNFYNICKDGNTEQIDVYWGTTDRNFNRKYNIFIEINTQTEMVTFQLVDLSDNAYDDMYGKSMRFVNNEHIMEDNFKLSDIDECLTGLRSYLSKMFVDLTPFPMFNEE